MGQPTIAFFIAPNGAHSSHPPREKKIERPTPPNRHYTRRKPIRQSHQMPRIVITHLPNDEDFPMMVAIVGLYDMAFLMTATENPNVFDGDGISVIINNDGEPRVVDTDTNQEFKFPITQEYNYRK